MAKFYLTTAIDYPVVAPGSPEHPHVGTSFEKLGADVQARYRRFKGDDVFFLMGNDENTWKVAKRARELGEDPKAYCDRMANEFKAVWDALDISYDDFIQTTEPRHIKGVQAFIQVVYDAGYIYKKKYSGLYCDGCEAFKTDKEIANGKCPNHLKQELRFSEEENYFFKLSEFREELLNRISPVKRELLIEPESRYKEVLNFIVKELEDISISRKNEGWGIPIPWDNSQVVYVWFDALLNYMTGVGLTEEGHEFAYRWPADVHFIGKDITRFHCVVWPAMIMAYNKGFTHQSMNLSKVIKNQSLDLPKKVFAHGFINISGEKISKSGKFIDPMEIVKEFGCDAYRYYFLSKCDYGSDGEYSFDHFVEVYNADLANNLGNLVSRVVSMALKYFDGNIPPVLDEYNIVHGAAPIADYCDSIERCEYKYVLEKVWAELRRMNEYIEHLKPWAVIKEDPKRAAQILRNLINGLRATAMFLKPFLPSTSLKIYESFGFVKDWELLDFNYLENFLLRRLGESHYNVSVSRDIIEQGRPTALFQRYGFSHQYEK